MDQHVLHNIIHNDSGRNSATCPVCNGEMQMSDKKGLTAAANKILQKRQSMGMTYTEDEEKLNQFNESTKTVEVKPFIDVMSFAEDTNVPTRIKLVPIGKYKTRSYGEVNISKDDLLEMQKHFEKGVRAGGTKTGLPIDVEHGTTQHRDAAAGWLKKIFVQDDGAYGDIEWTPLGKKLLTDKEYKFYSPEFHPNYVDPENTDIKLKNVMTGGGLVNKPMFKKDLPPVVMSEAGVEAEQNSLLTAENKSFTLFLELGKTQASEKTMNLKAILAKEASTRTAEEVKFLAEHKDELTFAEAKKEGFAEDKAAAPKNDPAAPAKVTAGEGETVIKASELADLKERAGKGEAAFIQLERQEVRSKVEKIAFEEGKGTRLASDQVDKWTDRLMKMNETERKETLDMLAELPIKQIFEEKGGITEIKGADAGKKLDEMVQKYMEDHKGTDYSSALSIVAAQNKQLFSEFNENLPVARQER